MTAYKINQSVFALATIGLIGLFALGWNNLIWWPFYPVYFLAIAFCLHYELNIIHLASHQRLSKNRYFNNFIGNISAILGGVTLADFKSTHFLHHKNPGDPLLDPDHYITTSGNMFWMPFKLWYHDIYFWKNGLWKQNNQWRGYLIDRFVQLALIIIFLAFGKWWLLIFFWSWAAWFVGFFNGLFLFYFPHYSTKLEQIWRSKKTTNFWPRISLELIDISRIYHEKHHDKVPENRNYYPVYAYVQDNNTNKTWDNLKQNQTFKYFHPVETN